MSVIFGIVLLSYEIMKVIIILSVYWISVKTIVIRLEAGCHMKIRHDVSLNDFYWKLDFQK